MDAGKFQTPGSNVDKFIASSAGDAIDAIVERELARTERRSATPQTSVPPLAPQVAPQTSSAAEPSDNIQSTEDDELLAAMLAINEETNNLPPGGPSGPVNFGAGGPVNFGAANSSVNFGAASPSRADTYINELNSQPKSFSFEYDTNLDYHEESMYRQTSEERNDDVMEDLIFNMNSLNDCVDEVQKELVYVKEVMRRIEAKLDRVLSSEHVVTTVNW